jgi:hypothetical protein
MAKLIMPLESLAQANFDLFVSGDEVGPCGLLVGKWDLGKGFSKYVVGPSDDKYLEWRENIEGAFLYSIKVTYLRHRKGYTEMCLSRGIGIFIYDTKGDMPQGVDYSLVTAKEFVDRVVEARCKILFEE